MFRGGLRGIRLLSTSPSPPSPPMFTDNLGNPSPFKKVVPRAQRPPSSPSVRPAMNRSDKRPTYQGHPSPPARGQFKTGILSSESRQESSPPLGRKDDTGFKRRGRVDREQRSSNTQNSTKRRETDPTASTTRTHVKKEIVDDPRVYLQPGTTLATLSNLLRVPFDKLQWKLQRLGLSSEPMAPEHILDSEMASLIVLEYNRTPVIAPVEAEIDLKPRPPPEDPSMLPLRPPVVTIMGHVDHGKTTLLDSIRQTSVAAGEAGGITQHIGAFLVSLPDTPSQKNKTIAFLDTPGHAAFSAMRGRGAQVTDMVVLVVAADDGVKPQTLEAIKHAETARVPIIVAINKMDKHGVNPDKVKQGLLQHNVILEDFGGDVQAIPVSALKGTGLAELQEAILTLAEVLEVRGDPTGPVEGVVIESRMVKGMGHLATVMVKRGTLQPGNLLVAGTALCKVKSMRNEHSKIIKSAGPSVPVEVGGWRTLPEAGDLVLEASDEALAKKVIESREALQDAKAQIASIQSLNETRSRDKLALEEAREQGLTPTQSAIQSLRKSVTTNGSEPIPVLPIILKADVHGSLEALTDALAGIPSHEARLQVIHSAVGPVHEADVDLAQSAGAHIFTFNVPMNRKIQSQIDSHSIPLKEHTIIYHFLDDVKECLSDLLPPIPVTSVSGEAQILAIFQLSGKKANKVAGCKVQTGKILGDNRIKVLRQGEVLFDGLLNTFKHHKKDIQEAVKGMECGMAFEGFENFLEGDQIQSYSVTMKKRTVS